MIRFKIVISPQKALLIIDSTDWKINKLTQLFASCSTVLLN